MPKSKTVIVSCGTAIATSTVVAKAIEAACKAQGVPVVVKQCKAAEIPMYLKDGADLIVTTSQVRGEVNVPVIKGLAFLTGVGTESVLKQIMDVLKQ